MKHTHLEQELLQSEAAVTNDAVQQQLLLRAAIQQPSLLYPCACAISPSVRDEASTKENTEAIKLERSATKPTNVRRGQAVRDWPSSVVPKPEAVIVDDQAGAQVERILAHVAREIY
ncbi:hypothetical protein CYMTET_33103 [Cymbomonas tetramitiformis]|uniref:Uncharacterized protein n=1 Tax=Cymbomonas tetramitiformis TaxID=36881 RepID=A0AAE0FDQ7_9CHLO|nr:hypothetical protein CYMTET_33103 [Cymbomonas tetramitiformis]